MDTLFEQVLQLPVADKLRLLEKLATLLKNEVQIESEISLESLHGIWANQNIDISEENIADARRDMWKNFPREDI